MEDDGAEPHRLRQSDRSAAEKQLSRRRRLLALLERRRESLVERRRPFRAPYRWNKLPAAERMQVRSAEGRGDGFVVGEISRELSQGSGKGW